MSAHALYHRVGQYVQAGTALIAVVPLQSVYVVANFKETQLTAMREGEAANFKVDSFPGQIVHGHIDSLAPASGQEFLKKAAGGSAAGAH